MRTWGGCRRGLSLHVPGLSACPFVCWGRAVDPHSPIGTPWDADTHDSRWVPRHKNHPTHSSYRREARLSDERVVSRQFSCRFSFFVFVGTTRTHRATAINRTALICAQPRAPAACNSSATLSRTLHTVVCVVASLSRTRSDALRSSRLPLLSDLTRLHGRCVARRLRHGWWCFQE